MTTDYLENDIFVASGGIVGNYLDLNGDGYASFLVDASNAELILADNDGSGVNVLDELRELRRLVSPQRVLVKCRACGQWGAVMTPCRHCGSPIDPE